MIAQLVYLHIEKSAGTSQRRLLVENYGQDKVFWLGVDTENGKVNFAGLTDYRVVGGHANLPAFARNRCRNLYTAVVRDPVDRALSLFHYYAVLQEEKARAAWSDWGLDPTSLARTLERCPRFRQQASNQQCVRIGGKPTFEAALAAMTSNNFVVGAFEDLPRFNDALGELLGWPVRDLPTLNVGTPNYRESLLAEPGVAENLASLNVEDRALHEHVRNAGVHMHLPDRDLLVNALSADCPPGAITFSAADIAALHLRIVEPAPLRLRAGARAHVTVEIANGSAKTLESSGDHPVRLAYHLYDEDGGVIEYEGLRTPLPANVYPGESVRVSAIVRPPQRMQDQPVRVGFSLMQVGRKWFETVDRSHLQLIDATIQVDRA